VRKAGPICLSVLFIIPPAASATGVTPYLPLNMAPEIQAQIERVLILADQPVTSRPIPAALVLRALPKACRIDSELCERVRKYLDRFTNNYGVTHVGVEGTTTSGRSNTTVPNQYGMREQSSWDASAQGYYQLNDYVLANVGAVSYEGKTDLAGSMVSLGFSYAQLDFGFKPHWLSPLTDSSMLISTEAPTMPSVSLSNWEPISSFGLKYELFVARMSTSDHIFVAGRDVRGNPRVAGFHLSMEPASGWSLAVNRLLQYGGPGRPSGWKDLFKSFFNPSRYDNTNPDLTVDQQFGNEQASITSSLVFPGKVPFEFYAEYAGEDTSRGKSYLLGNSALSVGIHFPSLWQRFDLTLESSEWQNTWYTHFVYRDGMTNYGRVIGNWFGDERQFNDGVGGRSQMVRIGWDATFGGLLELRARSLQNQQYSGVAYRHYNDFSLAYSRPWKDMVYGAQVDTGHDVTGARFTRLAGFVRYDEGWSRLGGMMGDSGASSDEDKKGELFIETGGNLNRQNVDVTNAKSRVTGSYDEGPHLAVGARRYVSDHSDLGARLEIDEVQGRSLIGVRALDYRYRFNGPLALGFFIGAARYAQATPAYGIYYGAGLQWRNLLPGVDVGVDYRYADSVARDHLLPTDPQSERPDSFYNISLFTASVSYHF
jgi:hypothetical protein